MNSYYTQKLDVFSLGMVGLVKSYAWKNGPIFKIRTFLFFVLKKKQSYEKIFDLTSHHGNPIKMIIQKYLKFENTMFRSWLVGV